MTLHTTTVLTLVALEQDLIARCQEQGSGEFGYWFEELWSAHIAKPCGKALKWVRKPGDKDRPREAFITFFLTYRRFREWVGRMAAALNIEEAEIDGYAKWREADAAFVGKVSEFPDISAMSALRGFVRDQEQEGFPSRVNRTATTVLASRSEAPHQ